MRMDDEKLKRILQEAAEWEADQIMEEVNSDPEMHDVEAPEIIHQRLFQQIHEHEASKQDSESVLTEEEKKYITYKIETEGFQYAPTRAGQIAGKVYYYYKDNLIATDNLYIGGDTPFSETNNPDNNFWRSFRLIFSFFK